MSLSAGRPSKNVKDQLALSDVTDSSKKDGTSEFQSR